MILLELTHDPGYVYCPRCNTLGDWQTNMPNCSKDGMCRGRGILPIPTTSPRP